MRFILTLFLHVSLIASSYDFDEIKHVSAVDADFIKSGSIEISKNRTIITYKEAKFKKIIKTDSNISIESSQGDIYNLKGNTLYYTTFFVDIMTKLGNFDKIKINRDFSVKRENNIFYITFLGNLSDAVERAEVKIKKLKVVSFKLFMSNEDTLEIIKK